MARTTCRRGGANEVCDIHRDPALARRGCSQLFSVSPDNSMNSPIIEREQILKKMLKEDNVLDLSTYFLLRVLYYTQTDTTLQAFQNYTGPPRSFLGIPDWKSITTMIMELTGEQLKMAETELKNYLPRSQQVYGCLVLRNRVRSDPAKVLVDAWPKFSVIIYKPQCEQKGDLFKDILVFADDDAILEETIRQSSVIDWTSFLCVGINVRHMEIFKAVASEKDVSINKLAVCHMLKLEDVSKLPSIDSSGISLSSLDESHVSLVNQKWKFGNSEVSVRMIRNMIANFPSCCVLDAKGQPVCWILTYASCAMGMLYTLPEHRGKGYAKAVIITMAKRLHAQNYPVYCFIEEENMVSYKLFKNLGFTEDPSYRETWFAFNGINESV